MQEAENQKITLPVDESVLSDAERRCAILEMDNDEPYRGLTALAAGLLHAPVAGIAVISGDRQVLKGRVGISADDASEPAFSRHTLGLAGTPTVDVVSDASHVQEFAAHPWVAQSPGIRFYAGAPIVVSGHMPAGVLFVAAAEPRTMADDARQLLRDLAAQAAFLIDSRLRIGTLESTVQRQRKDEEDLKAQVDQIHGYSRELQVHAVRLEAINARLEALAKLDGMTGLKNHRAFQERLEFEFQRAMRYTMPLSLLLLDVDNFKQFNDTYGHLAGDEVLKTVAQVLQDNARGVDFVARYGGEEFVVILPHADNTASVAIGDRLRAAIENVVWPLRSVTASFGISTLTHGMTHASDLIALADKALYGSKTGGRNRVTHCSDMGNDAK